MKPHRMHEMDPPPDLDDDVHGTVMTQQEIEGIGTRMVHGRWTGLYRKTARGWHLVNVFTSRKEAVLYFSQISDGKTYALAALRGTLEPVVQIT